MGALPLGAPGWCPGPPLPDEIMALLQAVGIHLAGDAFPVGWSSELALTQCPWCHGAAAALDRGWLWVPGLRP